MFFQLHTVLTSTTRGTILLSVTLRTVVSENVVFVTVSVDTPDFEGTGGNRSISCRTAESSLFATSVEEACSAAEGPFLGSDLAATTDVLGMSGRVRLPGRVAELPPGGGALTPGSLEYDGVDVTEPGDDEADVVMVYWPGSLVLMYEGRLAI